MNAATDWLAPIGVLVVMLSVFMENRRLRGRAVRQRDGETAQEQLVAQLTETLAEQRKVIQSLSVLAEEAVQGWQSTLADLTTANAQIAQMQDERRSR